MSWSVSVIMPTITITGLFNPEFGVTETIVCLIITVIFLVPAIILTRKQFAVKHFKANSICYDAKILELIKIGLTVRNGMSKVTVKCAFEDSNGESRVITSRNRFFVATHMYELTRKGFKKITVEDKLAAKVYVDHDNPEKFEVELFHT